MLHALVARKVGRLLLTVRAGSEVPELITALWKDDRLTRIDLGPLAPAALDLLTEACLDGPVDSASLHRLRKWCAGSPLLLRELLLSGRESGALEQTEGVWRWGGEAVINDRLAGVIGARLDNVKPRERRIIEAVALAEPVEMGILRPWGGASALEALERQGLVITSVFGNEQPVVRLHHPLYGELLRSKMKPLSRRRILSALADQLLAQSPSAPDDRFRAALWRSEASSPIDPGLLLDAAKRATSLLSYELGERLARQAVASGAGAPARLQLGLCLYWLNRYEECAAVLSQIERDDPTEAERAEAANIHSAALFWGSDRTEEAVAVLERRGNCSIP